MAFVEPAYENRFVDLAGDALIGVPDAIKDLHDGGMDFGDIVNNWRSSHHYPLNTFQMTLRQRARRVDKNSIVAQRVKRLSSIEEKLQRYQGARLNLSEVQDIAGCRAIVESVDAVDELVSVYKRRNSAHILDSENDYIRSPKRSGYRGYHLIYRYKGRAHREYDDLKIEIQFRSALQHCWATAVETADIFYGEGLKSSRGSPGWTRFFALMSSAMAIREGRRRVPHTPRDNEELVRELKALERKLHVRMKLKAFGDTLRVIDEEALTRTNLKWIILAPDHEANGKPTLDLFAYRKSDLAEASARLRELERIRARGSDAVLVSVSEAASLRRAFPNYYLDTAQFLAAYDEAVS